MTTKKERLLVYKRALEIAIKDYEIVKSLYDYRELNPEKEIDDILKLTGLCLTMRHAIEDLRKRGLIDQQCVLALGPISNFQELMVYQPSDKNYYDHWWPTSFYNEETRHKRVEVLEEIIKNLEQV